MIPTLAGIHHLKLPVRDPQVSLAWYRSRLGYEPVIDIHDDGVLTGIAMEHPDGGPPLAVRREPERAQAAAGFDYFAIGVPDKESIEALATHLSALGEEHAGVHWATIGWVLPELHDPDGHEVRFYTIQQHTEPPAGDTLVVHDAVAGAKAAEAARQGSC